ncbi:MAG: serine/threonine protein kinase, partial [Gammaproteobacteria bacterium]|nr:serine/threonine protein kinase [Gammaproteobacteria bacterium]
MTTSRNALSPGHQIHWYVIARILGQGGFGITYLAKDSNLGRDVAIKEYLPSGMAIRETDSSVQPVTGEQGEQYKWGLERFISEAQTLAKFKHPNIVQVYSVFSENNTAYMVMEFEQGQALDSIIKQQKTLPESEIKKILLPLLDGLEQVHAFGFIHRDIKPANIFIRENGSPVLLDFGSARQSLGEHTQTLTAMVSPGFAPFEQYSSKGDK